MSMFLSEIFDRVKLFSRILKAFAIYQKKKQMIVVD